MFFHACWPLAAGSCLFDPSDLGTRDVPASVEERANAVRRRMVLAFVAAQMPRRKKGAATPTEMRCHAPAPPLSIPTLRIASRPRPSSL